MSSPSALIERLVPAETAAGPTRVWFDAHGLPTGHEEGWRYTAVDDIAAVLDEARPPRPVDGAIPRALVDEIAGDHGGPRLVFVNGALCADASDLDALPSGVRLGVDDRDDADAEPADGFAALNELAGADLAGVLVDDGVRLDRPLHVVTIAAPGGIVAAVHPRTLVHVGRGSRVDIIETYAGLHGSSVTNASTRLVVGDSAEVTYQRVEAETSDAVHVGRTRIEQAAGSHVHVTSVMTGASAARSAIEVRLGGPGAHVDLRGLYLPSGHQRHDNVVTVDHAAPHCTSTQLFKGVIGDHGRGSFTGHVIVRQGAAGTDASQSNANLLLRPTAQADTRPWLEILADDVRCAHGATVGRLDADALFYLRSRGIPVVESRAMLVGAFVAEIVDGISPASLRTRVAAASSVRVAGSAR